MRFFFNNQVVDNPTAFSVSSQEVAFPGINVQNSKQTTQWRTPGDGTLADEFAKFRIDSAPNVRALVVLNHDILAADTIKFQGNATDAFGSPTVDEVVTHSTGIMSKIITVENLAWWRLAWTKNVATTVYNVGRIFIGDFYDTEINPHDKGFTLGTKNRTISREAYGGQKYTLARVDVRTFKIQFRYITETDRLGIQAIIDLVGTHTPFFFQIIPGEPGLLGEIIYGFFSKLPSFKTSAIGAEQQYNTTFDIEEAL